MTHRNTTNNFQRHLSRPSSYIPPQDHNSQKDNIERLELLSKLKRRTQDYSDFKEVSLEGAAISLESGSSLEEALQPARVMLRNMVEKASFKTLLMKLRLSENSLFEVTANGQVKAHSAGRTLSFEGAFKLAPDLNDDLVVLVELAQLTGGVVTLDDQVSMTQWLKFHRYFLPRTVIDAQNLIAFLEQQHPVSPPFGNYWEMIQVGENNSLTMSSAQRSRLRALIKEHTKGKSLLEHLSDTILGGRSTPFKRSDAEYFLKTLVSSSIALIWANSFVRDLDWYGAQDNQPLSDESLQQILLTALLLDLHPMVGEQEPRNQVAGFDLYAAQHIEKSFASVQTEFERHLINNHRITEHNAALASHLLLAGTAPEFLIKDLPPTLLLGTPQWVDYCRTIAVQEIISPGSSRSMTHAQIQHLMKSEPVTESQQTLNALAAVDPVIDWALLNGIVTHNEVNRSVKDSLEVAVAAYARHAKTIAETAETLSRPLPTRKSVALDILKQVAKGCTYLEDDVLHQKSNRTLEDAYAKPFLISPVDLLMSNDLQTGDWDLKHGESIYKAFPKMLSNLISPDGEFYRQFNPDYVSHEQAMSTHLKLALSSLPRLDRARLLRGQVTIFSVRPSVATLHPITRPPMNPLSSTLDVILKVPNRVPMESQKDKEQATGRYGVVMCTSFEGRLSCYELFTLHGVCRENTELAKLIERENLLHTSPRSSGTNHSHPAPVHQLPTDIECYTHGVTPGLVNTSRGVIEKIGELSATALPSNIESKGYYQSFYSSEFDPLVNFVLKHRPIATYDELVKECWGQTRLEALRAEREQGLNTFLNIVVPFKSCIEDISSDDLDRQFQGVAACTLEAAMTLLLVVGVVAKVASLAVRSMTLATKASAMAKTGLGLVSSLLNPLDGVTDLLIGGAKLLRKGFNGSVAALENAISDLRQLTGQPPFKQLAKAVDPDIIRLGTWRPAQTSLDTFQVWGIRHNDEWYALNRFGEPWGAKLKGFGFKLKLPTPRWHKVMPNSYSRTVIKEGLPLASRKVDDAINVLNDPTLVQESNAALDLLLANDSSAARSTYRDYLIAVKEDLSNIKPGNFIFDSGKESDAVAELHWGLYNDWKTGNKAQNANNEFFRVHSNNFNEAYRRDHFNPGVTADTFVHEIFHGTPKTKDFAYAEDSGIFQRGSQQLDVSPLLNLANGKTSMGLPSFPNTNYNRGTAFKNADSFALTTSLLSQLKTNKQAYQQNIATMKAALKNANHGYISGQTLVKINIL
ncbi:hypothetical protein [Pseudomonas brassicacearum]|uniref:Dermonecrotic toxin n=1 Tax=Pseudomonas brassicacearum TaxID=930166 RepID=A0A423JWI3_9PSED|nr:hypothetical protein [Pseudomonas brassicacearum]RON42022.1 hypothetical protein BK664_00030 [Pseudomonas brassicacearum]